MLVLTARTSAGWQPAVPQACWATRRSPGLTNRMYSKLSRNHFVYGRTGLAELRPNSGLLGCGWACLFACSYSAEPAAAQSGRRTSDFPPWQSVQPSRTVPVGCIVGSSVRTWQAMQPALLRSASAWDCWSEPLPAASAEPVSAEGARTTPNSSRQTLAKNAPAGNRRLPRFRMELWLRRPGACLTPMLRFSAFSFIRARGGILSELQAQVCEQREQRLPRVDVPEAAAGRERGSAAGQNDVLGGRRPVLQTDAVVHADGVVDGRLEQQQLEGLGAVKAQEVDVDHAAQLRCQLEVRPGQPDAFSVPQAEDPSGKRRKILNGIKAAGAPIAGIRVARGPEHRALQPRPILVHRKLERGHLGVDGDASPGERIQVIASQGLIERVVEIEPADVAAAGPAQIDGANVVRPHGADGRRAHQEIVLIEVESGVVLVVMHTELRSVAGPQEILPVEIGDQRLLVPPCKCVQAAVGVFFEEMEVGQVILPAVRVQVAKNAHAGLLLDEQETSKIAVEGLDARPHGNEIVVGAEVAELELRKCLLQPGVGVQARRALADINVDDAQLAHLQVVDVDRRSHPDAPIHWAERRIAVKEVEGEPECLLQQNLLASAKKFRAPRARRADVAGHRHAPPVEKCIARRSEIEKSPLAEDGRVALQLVAVKRIPPVPTDVRGIDRLAVAVPLGHGDIPPVRQREENLLDRRQHFGL